MNKQILEVTNEASKALYESTKEAVALNSATLESVVEKQIEVLGQVVDYGMKQMKLWTEAKDFGAAVTAQGKLVEEANAKALDNIRDFVEIGNKTRVAMDKLYNKNVKTATANVKAVTEKVAKAA